MAFSKKEDAYRYIKEYQEKTYDRVTLMVPKGKKEWMKEAAKKRGMSLSNFVIMCIEKEEKNS